MSRLSFVKEVQVDVSKALESTYSLLHTDVDATGRESFPFRERLEFKCPNGLH